MTKRSKRKGFTLIELVVVLSIMVILATLGIVGYQSSFPPGVISAARNEIHGMLRFARQQAITQGSNSILIVNYEKADTEKFLRYVGVIVEDEYNSGKWNAAHSGVYLPEGVFFVPQIVDSATDGFSFDAAWPADGADPDIRSQYNCSNVVASPNAIGAIEYPVNMTISLDASTGDEQDWIGFQFGPDGRVKGVDFSACSAGDGSQSNHIILGTARRLSETDLRFEKSENALGIILRRNGVSYAVNDTDAM